MITEPALDTIDMEGDLVENRGNAIDGYRDSSWPGAGGHDRAPDARGYGRQRVAAQWVTLSAGVM